MKNQKERVEEYESLTAPNMPGDGAFGRYGTCAECGRHKVVGPLDVPSSERTCIVPLAARLIHQDTRTGCEIQSHNEVKEQRAMLNAMRRERLALLAGAPA